MAAFYLDHDVSIHLAPVLRQRRHQAITARDLGLTGAEDPEQVLTAARHGSILLTHNQGDFAVLHQAWLCWPPQWGTVPVPRHAGLLTLDRKASSVLVDVVEEFLLTAPALANELYRWRRGTWEQWRTAQAWVPYPGSP